MACEDSARYSLHIILGDCVTGPCEGKRSKTNESAQKNNRQVTADGTRQSEMTDPRSLSCTHVFITTHV